MITDPSAVAFFPAAMIVQLKAFGTEIQKTVRITRIMHLIFFIGFFLVVRLNRPWNLPY